MTSPEPAKPASPRPRRFAILILVAAGLTLVLVIVSLAMRESGDDGFTHVYELNGSLEDDRGGPALAATGGTVGPDGFLFERGDGLTANVDLGESYTIEFRVRIDEWDHAAKLLDFHDLGDDSGFYVFEEARLLYWFTAGCNRQEDEPQGCSGGFTRQPLGGAPDAVVPSSWMTVTLVRDGEAGSVTADLDGKATTWEVVPPPWITPDEPPAQVDYIDDFMGEAVQDDAKLLHILLDDRATISETGSGELDYVKIAVN
jgi:hypothetical protein